MVYAPVRSIIPELGIFSQTVFYLSLIVIEIWSNVYGQRADPRPLTNYKLLSRCRLRVAKSADPEQIAL